MNIQKLKTCSFTGHRPSKLLGGYDWNNQENIKLGRKIRDAIVHLIENEGVDTFICGGALGVDQMAFSICQKLKENRYPSIKIILAMPFEKQAIKWNSLDKTRLSQQKENADFVALVDTIEGYKMPNVKEGDYHVAKMQIRNRYMVDNSTYVIAVWDGTSGGTANCVKYAQKEGKSIIKLNPQNLEVSYL